MDRMAEFADLIVKVGLNLQPGQTLLISAPVEAAEIARLCAKSAYAAGCREVVTFWSDDEMSRLKYLHADDEVFDEFPAWTKSLYDTMLEKTALRLAFTGNDPEALLGVDADRIMRWRKVSGKEIKAYSDAQSANVFQWCVASYAGKAWAKKVFPEMSEDKAVESLWDKIYETARVTGDGKSAQRWQEHIEEGRRRVEILNKMNLRSLHYKNGLGTDFTVELPEGAYWTGACELARTGFEFVANIPTEEIFTLPKKDGINGRMVASMPLAHDGNIIDGFAFEVRDGKIIGVTAEKGEDILKAAISVDEGASRFGEIALVQYDSPISRSGILYYNTLFDENASCHLAFGRAYPLITGAETMTEEQLAQLGVNNSITHVDFMIGTPDLEITGLRRDGGSEKIFSEGNFVF